MVFCRGFFLLFVFFFVEVLKRVTKIESSQFALWFCIRILLGNPSLRRTLFICVHESSFWSIRFHGFTNGNPMVFGCFGQLKLVLQHRCSPERCGKNQIGWVSSSTYKFIICLCFQESVTCASQKTMPLMAEIIAAFLGMYSKKNSR